MPTIAYGIVLLLAGVTQNLLQSVIVVSEGPDSALATALGRDRRTRSEGVAAWVS
jgi:hypothetical protein